MDNTLFIKNWLVRSKDCHRSIDKTDQFLALWIAVNAWLKSKYGESKSDFILVKSWKMDKDFKKIYDNLLETRMYKTGLSNLGRIQIIDMRNPNDEDKFVSYDGSFSSLIDAIYRIRCNLFHGRKLIEANQIDESLVHLAYDLLDPLFTTYCQQRGF